VDFAIFVLPAPVRRRQNDPGTPDQYNDGGQQAAADVLMRRREGL
jgi:hypothetical protein